MANDLEIKQDKDGVEFTFPIPDDPKACFFCDHCTDIFYDWNGPYMFICQKDHNDEIERGLEGKCPDFYETTE